MSEYRISFEKDCFKTIRQVAGMGILSEHHLRKLHKENRLPGIYSGNRFLINVKQLIEIMDKKSLSEIKEEM